MLDEDALIVRILLDGLLAMLSCCPLRPLRNRGRFANLFSGFGTLEKMRKFLFFPCFEWKISDFFLKMSIKPILWP